MSLFDWLRSKKALSDAKSFSSEPDINTLKSPPNLANTSPQSFDEGYQHGIEHSASRVSELEALLNHSHIQIADHLNEINELKRRLQHSRKEHKSVNEFNRISGEREISVSTLISDMETLAEEGWAVAQFYMGIGLAFGVGLKRNSFLAEKWMIKSSVQESPAVYFCLGSLKHQGIFLDRGLQQALHWLKLAQKLGFVGAEETIAEVVAEIEESKPEAARPREVNDQKPTRNIRKWAHESERLDDVKLESARPSNISAIRQDDDYKGAERIAFNLGHRRGRKCLKKAIRFNKLMPHFIDGYTPLDISLIAKRFAMRIGYLQHEITEGMETFPSERYPITPEVREAFIKGVRAGYSDYARFRRTTGA